MGGHQQQRSTKQKERDVDDKENEAQSVAELLQKRLPDASRATIEGVVRVLDRVDRIGQEHAYIYFLDIFDKAGAENPRRHANEVVRALGWIDDGGDQDAKKAQKEPEEQPPSGLQPEEMVMVAKVKESSRQQASRSKAKRKAGASTAEQTGAATLGFALSSLKRLPKPRTTTSIDELVWAAAADKAAEEIKMNFKVKTNLDEYYKGMCEMCRSLLAAEMQRKTQGIYDFRASKLFSKKQKLLL